MGAVLNIEEEDYSKTVKPSNEEFLKNIAKYDGDKSGLPTLTVHEKIKSSKWNFSLIVPLMPNEIVHIHPDQKDVDEQYIRVIHSDHNAVSIFHKSHFIDPTVLG